MTDIYFAFGFILLGYLLGSIPSAYVIGKVFFNVDIRNQGSGNVGGANAGRLFGKGAFAGVAIFDLFKGWISVILAFWATQSIINTSGILPSDGAIIAFAGFASIVGHCYSIFLKFSGGKGAATTAGVTLAIDPLSFLALLVFWVIVVASTRFTSLGNLLGVLVLPGMFVLRTDSSAYSVMAIILILFIFWRHRENVSRLLRGEERKFGNREQISQPTRN